MLFSGSNYHERALHRPQPIFVFDALSPVNWGWEDREPVLSDGAQKSLQVESSLLAAAGVILKQADCLLEFSAPRYLSLELRCLKKCFI